MIDELKNKSEWVVLTMQEMWELHAKDIQGNEIFSKPTFPTKRWGKTFTKTSTDDIKTINLLLIKYKEKGFSVRKRIDYETMKRFHPSYGKFYYIEIKK